MRADDGAAIGLIPDDWLEALGAAGSPDRLWPIAEFVAEERRSAHVLPDPDLVFAALDATPFASVRAVVLGQDPYPTASHATGLAFSVPMDVAPLPRSLRNIRAELRSDLGLSVPGHGSLESWTRHGVLLLNTALTVREGVAGSHDRAGWADLTDSIISTVAAKGEPIAFLLWGLPAKAKATLVDETRHVVVRSSHPSPLSQKGFLGSRPFSRANIGLRERGAEPIDWSLEAHGG
jgi:uracil-DNA glycosylase